MVGVVGEPAVLDPYDERASELTYALIRPLYPSLYTTLPDGSAEPSLAASIEDIPDGVRVTLRDASWSDGDPITARDVADSIKRARPPSGLARVDSVVVEGRRTISLHGDVADWPTALATVAFVLPNGRPETRFGGPFVLARRVSGLRFVYEPNERYFGPKPFVDRLDVVFVQAGGLLTSLLEKGKIDVSQPPVSVNYAARLESMPFEHRLVQGWESIRLDFTDSGLARSERLGVWSSIDREAIAERVLRESGRISNTLTPEPGPGGARGPFARLQGTGTRPPTAVRLVVPYGDEFISIVQRALYEQLTTAGFQLELVGMEPLDFYSEDPAGIRLSRAAGAPGIQGPARPLRDLPFEPLFQMRTATAWAEEVHGVEANPTLEGVMWNAQEWWVDRD